MTKYALEIGTHGKPERIGRVVEEAGNWLMVNMFDCLTLCLTGEFRESDELSVIRRDACRLFSSLSGLTHAYEALVKTPY